VFSTLVVAEEMARADIEPVEGKKPKKAATPDMETQSVGVYKNALAPFSEWCAKGDRNRTGILSTLLEWWMSKPVSFRLYSLGDTDPEFAEMYATALEAMAEEARALAGKTASHQEGSTTVDKTVKGEPNLRRQLHQGDKPPTPPRK
jgi:hypothetical protein